jgi:hypothetical protein
MIRVSHHAAGRAKKPGVTARAASQTPGISACASSGSTSLTRPTGSYGSANAFRSRSSDTSPAIDAIP